MISNLELRLYVAGDAPNSVQALLNLRSFAAEHFNSSDKIEIVDVLKHPSRALRDGVFLTPTLIRTRPSPLRKIVGSLSEPEVLRHALGVKRRAA
jgi:circadian clock protein KaiB